MSAIDDLFVSLRARHRKALMPFVTAGDPDAATTTAILKAAVEAGADMCEVGVPYSDPIADGPVIQASYQRALDRKFKLAQVFDIGSDVRKSTAAPLVTMVSYAIIHRVGLRAFVDRAKAAGYAGAIVPDLLVEEAQPLSDVCKNADFSLIQLVTPTTPRERQVRIASLTTGFIYYVSVTGITGERTVMPANLADNVAWLREQTPLPVCIGFGISGVDTARALAPHADGLIVGSAVVRRIADASSPTAAVESIGGFVKELRQAIDEV